MREPGTPAARQVTQTHVGRGMHAVRFGFGLSWERVVFCRFTPAPVLPYYLECASIENRRPIPIRHQREALKSGPITGNFMLMKTLTVDDDKRIRLPDVERRQVFAYEKEGAKIILTPIEPQEPRLARLVRENGRTFAVSDRPMTFEDTKAALADWP